MSPANFAMSVANSAEAFWAIPIPWAIAPVVAIMFSISAWDDPARVANSDANSRVEAVMDPKTVLNFDSVSRAADPIPTMAFVMRIAADPAMATIAPWREKIADPKDFIFPRADERARPVRSLALIRIVTAAFLAIFISPNFWVGPPD
jgi:hypothetical protein